MPHDQIRRPRAEAETVTFDPDNPTIVKCPYHACDTEATAWKTDQSAEYPILLTYCEKQCCLVEVHYK